MSPPETYMENTNIFLYAFPKTKFFRDKAYATKHVNSVVVTPPIAVRKNDTFNALVQATSPKKVA